MKMFKRELILDLITVILGVIVLLISLKEFISPFPDGYYKEVGYFPSIKALSTVILFPIFIIYYKYIMKSISEFSKVSKKLKFMLISLFTILGVVFGLVNLGICIPFTSGTFGIEFHDGIISPNVMSIIWFGVTSFFTVIINEILFRVILKKWFYKKYKWLYFIMQLFSFTAITTTIVIFTGGQYFNVMYIVLRVLIYIIFSYIMLYLEFKSKNSELNMVGHFVFWFVQTVIINLPMFGYNG